MLLTKEAVVKQFFIDFIENLGDNYEDDYDQDYKEEEANLTLPDLFFSGLLEIKWSPEKHTLILHFPAERACGSHVQNSDFQETVEKEIR